jgi:hypothetical protein
MATAGAREKSQWQPALILSGNLSEAFFLVVIKSASRGLCNCNAEVLLPHRQRHQ